MTTETMMERVALAIATAFYLGRDKEDLPDFNNPKERWRVEEFFPEAHAAIDTMRVPTQAMLDAVCSDCEYATIPAHDDDIREMWKTMIDAALKEERK